MNSDGSLQEDTAAPLNTVAYEGGDPGETPAATAGQRYTLNALHAAGGIGEIWLARDAELQRDVAVKRLQSRQSGSAAAHMRFLREARITGQLDHPGVVPVYEICVDETSGLPYYSMRFLRGKTLAEAVRAYHQQRQAGHSVPQAFLSLLGAFGIVCNTVAFAHSKGIIHRDLKCDNVILGDFGEVVVVDWGLAKEVGGSAADLASDQPSEDLETAHPTATLAGHILGTPAYMAPEQAAGRPDLIGPATDIYGLCGILYEILCGQPPFTGDKTLDVLSKVQRDAPLRPSDVATGVPGALERICLKGLAKSPQQRHSSAESLAKSVQGWVSELAERRQAEDERERFFALSLDLLAIVGEDGKLRQVSPAWEKLLGFDREQLTGHLLLEFVHADDHAEMTHYLGRDARERSDQALETRVYHRDQSYRWISWIATPIAKEHCVYMVGRDITDLKKSQQLFEGVLQSAPDAMVIVNAQRQIVMVNRQTENIFGYAAADLLGQPIEVLIPQRYRDRHPEHFASFFAVSAFRTMGAGLPLLGLRKDLSEFPVDIALSPICTEAGKLVVAAVRDLSHRERDTQQVSHQANTPTVETTDEKQP